MGVVNKTTDNINVLLDKTEDWKERGIEWTEVINKPHWVTSATKPTYTAAEVGALQPTRWEYHSTLFVKKTGTSYDLVQIAPDSLVENLSIEVLKITNLKKATFYNRKIALS